MGGLGGAEEAAEAAAEALTAAAAAAAADALALSPAWGHDRSQNTSAGVSHLALPPLLRPPRDSRACKAAVSRSQARVTLRMSLRICLGGGESVSCCWFAAPAAEKEEEKELGSTEEGGDEGEEKCWRAEAQAEAEAVEAKRPSPLVVAAAVAARDGFSAKGSHHDLSGGTAMASRYQCTTAPELLLLAALEELPGLLFGGGEVAE